MTNSFSREKNIQVVKDKKYFIGDPNGGFWGNIFFKKQKFQKALEKYSQALNHLKGNELAKLNYNIGNVFYKLNSNKKAEGYFENALKLTRDEKLKAMILYNQGAAEFKNQNYTTARELFKKSLKYNPEDDDARYNFEVCDLLKKEGEKKQESENKNSKNTDNKNQDDKKNKQTGNKKNDKQFVQLNKEDIDKILKALDEKEKEENAERSLEEQKSNDKGIKYW